MHPAHSCILSHSYILADEDTKEAIIIDPVLEQVERDLQHVERMGWKLTLAFNTHCHADHITGTGALKAKAHPELSHLKRPRHNHHSSWPLADKSPKEVPWYRFCLHMNDTPKQ